MMSIKFTRTLKWGFVLALLVLAGVGPSAQTTAGTLPTGQHHRWMDELFERRPAAMTQTLARFVFPGTHDSGTYRLQLIPACEGCKNSDIYTDLEAKCQDAVADATEAYFCGGSTALMAMFGQNWGQAQHLTVGQQLNAGARRFDLRFFRATADDADRSDGQLIEGTFYAHHSLAGPTSSEIFNDIAGFLNQPGHEREIIIIEFQQLMEGADSMSDESLAVLFNQLRDLIGPKMARHQVSECAGDPSCSATERFGPSTTIADFLAQGSQVIVTSGRTSGDPTDIWDYIDNISSYEIDKLNTEAIEGYPSPDNAYYPWRTDKEVQTLVEDLSARRDRYSRDEMFTLGVEVGLDEDEDVPLVKSRGILRSVVCPIDPANASGYCDAINGDWDQFETLKEAAAFLNPKALAALVSLRRDRVNIVTSDHYTPAFTEEVFKLNYGATQVRYQIDRVIESENPPLDTIDFDSDPDYYPAFWFPGTSPLQWQLRAQRNAQVQNDDDITPFWPAWKSYPNDWGTAVASFGIRDADAVTGGDDDWARINIPFPNSSTGDSLELVTESVPVTACVSNAASCLQFSDQQEASGLTLASAAEVHYRRSACVWSWLPGDIVDPNSDCGEAVPEVSVFGGVRDERNTGSQEGLEIVLRLTAPSLVPVSVNLSTSDGTATGGSDYVALTNTTVTFAPGQTFAYLKVLVNGDINVEGNETFTVQLRDPSNATIGTGSATATIQDDDDLPTLWITPDGLTVEGDLGVRTLLFEVSLSDASSVPVTVHYQTANGTATAVSDYGPLADTVLTFEPGETRKLVTVDVYGDYAVEQDETFFVGIRNATNARIARHADEWVAVIVNDDAGATITAPGPQSVQEGNETVFNLGTLLDGRPSGSWTVSVNWGDGSVLSSSVTPGSLAGSHVFQGNGTFTVTVSVTDGDGAISNVVTFQVAVANVNPTATLANNGSINEGGAVIVSFSGAVDPSASDTAAGFRYAFSCENASLASATYVTSRLSPMITCRYNDNGPQAVRARIIDQNGGFTEYTTEVIVNNVAPTATLSDNGPLDEGGSATISFSNPFDPSSADVAAGLHYAYSCSGGSLASTTYATTAATPSTSCVFTNDGVYTVRGRIIDKDGGATEYTTSVTVRDLTPVVTGAPAQSGNEGSSVAFTLGALADEGADGPWSVTVDWGDTHVESYAVAAVGALTRSHVYADNGVYTVTISARDKDNVASNAVSFAATIANVAPSITALGATIDENGVATVSGAIADPGVLDTLVITVSWGDGTSSPQSFAAGTTNYVVTHRFLDDNPTGTPSDSATVTLSVVDKDGGTGIGGSSVIVGNVAPQVGALQLEDETGTAIGNSFFALSGLPVDLQASFTDIGTLDTHQGSINWGDGTSGTGTITEDGGAGTLSASHTWINPGTFTVGATVTDDDTGAGTRQATIVVTDGKGAVCAIGGLLTSMLNDPTLNRATVSAMTDLLGKTYGNVDGLAANGACDILAKGNYVAAVVKLEQAVQIIAASIAAGGLTADHLAVFEQVEARLMLVAKWTAVTLARTTTDPQKLGAASILGQLADSAMASGDYITAIKQWLEAVRVLAPLT